MKQKNMTPMKAATAPATAPATATARRRGPAALLALAWALLGPQLAQAQTQAQAPGLLVAALQGLADLSLEELRDVVISSVARRNQSLLEAPASVYVIRGEDIRRIGATTLPEALRLAPNLQVAAIDARQYAISARGFNGNIANKLLVMVDGRTVYSPLFSGVFWDAQDFVPSDIDHIEVISGPAGVTWGTNAVNGVINVVTLSAAKTPGAALSATLGTLDKTVTARYGATLSPGLSIRGHLRSFERDPSQTRGGGDAGDAARGTTAGLRADWARGDDTLLLDAGVYRGRTDERPIYGAVELRGSHLTGRWSRRVDEAANFDLQAYVDRTERTDNFLLQEDARIVDIEAKYRRMVGAHRWLAGLGYRSAHDSSAPGRIFAFLPASQRQNWLSGFVQDEFTLNEQLALTLGLRMERNPYTGWEVLPNVRLGYGLSEGSLLWASVSRAVRSPSRFDREIFVPPKPPFVIAGGPDFQAEMANVAELGYRSQLAADLSFSATGFVQDYSGLRSGEIVGRAFQFGNGIAGQVRGVESWASWTPSTDWRLEAGLLWQDQALHLRAGSTDPTGPSNLGNDPSLQWSLRTTHSLGEQLDIGVAVRHVNRLPSPAIPAYTAADMTLNWRAGNDLQLSLGLRNAFDRRHAEYQGFSTVSEIPRSAFVALSYLPR